ncbi:MAG TPA: methyltransferase domain-containing protein [Streptosporangiaceae bacterium]|nr:methyltransferase domain-containing protein [Streptosporangiaceae bacterium]
MTPQIRARDAAASPRPESGGSLAGLRNPLREFYEDPGVPASSGPDRAYRQAEMLATLLGTADCPARIVDVGCGDGFATSVAAARNPAHHFVGIDWSAASIAVARRPGLSVLRGEINAPGLPIASGSVDVVVMSELIEHLLDTDFAVEEANRVLKPNGSLLLSTPNLAAWYNRALLAVGVQPVFSEVSLRSVFGRPGSQVAGHLHMFTRRALTEFLGAYGFTCVRVAGARYHDVPVLLRPFDKMFCHWPSAASILLVHARKS